MAERLEEAFDASPLSAGLKKLLRETEPGCDQFGIPLGWMAIADGGRALELGMSDLDVRILRWWLAVYAPYSLVGSNPKMTEDPDNADGWIPLRHSEQGCFYFYSRWFQVSWHPDIKKPMRAPWFYVPKNLPQEGKAQIEELGRRLCTDLQVARSHHISKVRQAHISRVEGALHGGFLALRQPQGLFFLTKNNFDEADQMLLEIDYTSLSLHPLATEQKQKQRGDRSCVLREPWDGGRVWSVQKKQGVIEIRELEGPYKNAETFIRATAAQSSSDYLGHPCNGIRVDEYSKMDYQEEIFADAQPNASHGNCWISLFSTNYGFRTHWKKLMDCGPDDAVGVPSDAYKCRTVHQKGYSTWWNQSNFLCIELSNQHDPRRSPDYYRGDEAWVPVQAVMSRVFLDCYSELECDRSKLGMLMRVRRSSDGTEQKVLRETWFVKQMLQYGPTQIEDFMREYMLRWSTASGKRMHPEFSRDIHVLRADRERDLPYMEPLPFVKAYVTLDIGPGTKPAAGFYQLHPGAKLIKLREYVNPDATFQQWAADCIAAASAMFPGSDIEYIHDKQGGFQKYAGTNMMYCSEFENAGCVTFAYDVADMEMRVNKVRESLRRLDSYGGPGFMIHPSCQITIAAYEGGYKRAKHRATDIYQSRPEKDDIYSHHMDCDQLMHIHIAGQLGGFQEIERSERLEDYEPDGMWNEKHRKAFYGAQNREPEAVGVWGGDL